MRAVVFGGPAWLAQRTLRACERMSVDAVWKRELGEALDLAPAWLLRAGTWFDHVPRIPPSSATGRPLVALGALPSPAWRAALAQSGGDLQNVRSLPPIASAWIEKEAILSLRDASSLEDGIAKSRSRLRLVRLAELDAMHDDALRVMQITTSLQQGGAERIVVDLVRGLRAQSTEVALVVVGRPRRKTFPAPEGTIDLSQIRSRAERIDAIANAVARFGPDVVHAHLLDGPLLSALAERGIRWVTTIHNSRPGWPAGFEDVPPPPLSVACANAVKGELGSRPSRTIRNAIDPGGLVGSSLRTKLGIAASDLVLLTVANPRPQKRLHLLPRVARAVADRSERTVRILLAGSPSEVHPDAVQSMEAMRTEAERCAIPIHLVGSLDDVGAAYRTADVLVSTSAWEGLSLAQLEALACGLPVVATDVGGAREVPGVRTVPSDAEPALYATRILEALEDSPSLPPAFRTPAMVERHAMLYRRVAVSRPGNGIALACNNFSTGGAQSSARRLLLALHAAGVPVRAFVVQEQPQHPTPGRAHLEAAGISVTAVTGDAREASNAILAAVDEDPPAAVLFWNLIAQHKILLADALLGMRIVDVSPGEMYFESLERHFTKPRNDVPYESPRDYGALLHAIVVKYADEAARAASVVGAPVRVIPNGIAPGSAPRAREPHDGLVLVTAARIAPQKRLEDLFDAVRLLRLPRWELRVVGGPETGSERYAEELRDRAAGLPVRWLGERSDVRHELDAADAMVMISEPAGCPNASLEAMAAGLPIVATDFGGAREQVIDGETGFLVSRRDPEAFARAIERLVPSMGERGRAHVVRSFSIEAMMASYREVCGV